MTALIIAALLVALLVLLLLLLTFVPSARRHISFRSYSYGPGWSRRSPKRSLADVWPSKRHGDGPADETSAERRDPSGGHAD